MEVQSIDPSTIILRLIEISPFVAYLAYQVWAANSERVKQRDEDQKRYDGLVKQVLEGLIQSNVAMNRLSDILEAGRGSSPPGGPR